MGREPQARWYKYNTIVRRMRRYNENGNEEGKTTNANPSRPNVDGVADTTERGGGLTVLHAQRECGPYKNCH